MENLLPFERVKREVLVKKKAETSEKFGKRPEERSIEETVEYGIVNIDKPQGPTSHQVSAYVQQILGVSRSGHSGTLDPKVTGVLPVALGRATRIVQALLKSGKEYVAIMHLHKPVEEERLIKVFEDFTGKIKQMPPIRSSVKRRLRTREIYYLELLEIDEKDVLFRVGCQAGTYIRKLIHDIGAKLGVGAHMTELRRTKAGPFNEETLVTLQDLRDAYYYYKEEGKRNYLRSVILPVEFGVKHLPKVWVLDTAVRSLCHGMNLAVPGISRLHSGIEPDQTVAVMTLKDELICLGTAKMNSKKILEEKRGVAVNVHKVFMKPETYPRFDMGR